MQRLFSYNFYDSLEEHFWPPSKSTRISKLNRFYYSRLDQARLGLPSCTLSIRKPQTEFESSVRVCHVIEAVEAVAYIVNNLST